MRHVSRQALASPLIEMFGALLIIALLAYARQRIVAGEMTPGEFAGFLAALLMLFQPVKRLNGIYNIFQQALGSAQRVFEYIDHPHDIREAPSPVDPAPFARSIQFSGVTFRYPDAANETALRDIDLTAHAGEVVALVGPSGAGKTTLMSLLPRFFDPQEGVVLIDGRDLRELRLDALRRQISIVTQDTFLFDDTVQNNIAYGRPDIPLEKVRAAAAAAIAADFIDSLPHGYRTQIGARSAAAAERRTAAAHLDRASAVERRADPAARRGDLAPRQRSGASGPAGAVESHGGPHGDRKRAPALDDSFGGQDRGARRRADSRLRRPRGGCCKPASYTGGW